MRKTLTALIAATMISCSEPCDRKPCIPQEPPKVEQGRYDNDFSKLSEENIERMLHSVDYIKSSATYQYDRNVVPQVDVSGGSLSHLVTLPEGHYFITSYHVVQHDAQPISFFWGHGKKLRESHWIAWEDGRTFPLELLEWDEKLDVALLRADPAYVPRTNPFNLFANDEEVHVGDACISIGYPFGMSRTLTEGIIISKGVTNPEYDKNDIVHHTYLVQTPINPGNSGGFAYVLQNGNPHIIGIGKFMTTNGSGGVNGIARGEDIKLFLRSHGHDKLFSEDK